MSVYEQSVIGACLLEPGAFWRVCDRLSYEDFRDARHSVLWRAIDENLRAGRPADAVTLADWLEQAGASEKAGGVRYVYELANSTPSAAGVEAYADIVAREAALRRLQAAGHAIAIAAKQHGVTPAVVVDEARRLLDGAMPMDSRAVTTAKVAVVESFKALQDRYERKDQIAGLATGIPVLDDATNGLQGGRLYVLAARPSMGKSLVAGWIAAECGRQGKRCAIFSAEMTAQEWTDRWVASEGRIPSEHIVSPKKLDDGEWTRITHAMTEIQQWPVMIDDSPSQSMSSITARSTQMHAAAPLSLIVIDHLGLLDLNMRKGETRASALGDATKTGKALAKRLNVPVLLLCQVNRDADTREPTMADLRDSGRIEEDADGVLLLHRPGYYDPSKNAGYTKLIVGKLRGGKRETLEVFMDLSRMRVEVCERDHVPVSAPKKQGFSRITNEWA